ncbi:MAG: FecR domain-containing protein [Eubacteriales bacterium]
MKKTKLLPLFLALGLIFTGCSKEETNSNASSSDNTQEGSSLFGNILGGGDSSTSADEMRLENFTGSITLQNNSEEKAVVLGSRLVTGDNIETMIESNAYVVLDKSKVLRVNETSQVEIVQEDKHLDIYLSKGTVFFNVTSTLSADESLEFQTNNVVTGVRGTSGIIHFDPVAQVTQIVVLTGMVTGTTTSEEQTIEAGQVAIVETLPDGTVEMTIYELEEDDPLYYFPDHFIDGMQGDLNFEGDSFNLSELVREPSEVSISGKVLSISSVLAVEDENGKLHTIDNSSGQTWEGVTLGGMVNLTYSGNTVTAIQQTAQGGDIVGAYVDAWFYEAYNFYAEPFGEWYPNTPEKIDFYEFRETNLTVAEQEAFIIRVKNAYAVETDKRLGTWEDLEAEATILGLPLLGSGTADGDGLYRYEGFFNHSLEPLSGGTEEYFQIGIVTSGSYQVSGLSLYMVTLDRSTGVYSIVQGVGAG